MMMKIKHRFLLLFATICTAGLLECKLYKQEDLYNYEACRALHLTNETADIYSVPEQVHISYGVDRTEMWITWMTFEESDKYTDTATVEFGFDRANMNLSRHGYSTLFMNVDRISFVHRVRLDKLKPNRVYYYRCGTEETQIWTDPFNFRTKPEDEENWSPTLAIYGDMGLENGISIPFLTARAAKSDYDAIFHVGDIAYNLHECDGRLGDSFMRTIQPIAAKIPYQTAVGNHEWKYNFTQYTNRYTMIDSLTGDQNNHFYSFNIGPVHVITFSSEWYNWYNYEAEYPAHNLLNLRIQYEWLVKDLAEASKPENRKIRPWIIAAGHRGMYCSTMDIDDCAYNESILRKGIPIVNKWGLEELFYKHGVDIIIGAHEHTYERLFPVYDRKVYNGSTDEPYRNPKAPVHLLVGSAGCRELLDPFVPHPKPWSAKRLDIYGVTEFEVLSKTHMRIRQRSTESQHYGQVVDQITIVKEKHGTEAWE